MAVTRSTRQFQLRGIWYVEVSVQAQDKKSGMTTAEIRAALANAPIDVHPQFMVRMAGQVREVKYKMEIIADDAE